MVISDLELEAISPERTRTIDIEQFVDLADVDPMMYDHPYFLVPAAPDDGTLRAYALLAEVMAGTDRGGGPRANGEAPAHQADGLRGVPRPARAVPRAGVRHRTPEAEGPRGSG